MTTSEEWATRQVPPPKTQPTVAALESWYKDGVSCALATPLPNGRTAVTVRVFKDVPTAGAFAQSSGVASIIAGKSIAGDAALIGSVPKGSTTRQSVLDLRRMLDDDVLTHDGSDELTNQLLAVRVRPGPDGPRVVSRGRMDAVKAVVWAVNGARVAAETPVIF